MTAILTFTNMSEIYASLQDAFSSHSEGMIKTFTSLAKSIGYIAIMIIWGVDIAKALASDGPIQFTKYLMPLALSILVSSYSLLSPTISNVAKSIESKMVENSHGLTIAERYNLLLKKDAERYKALSAKYASEAEVEARKKFIIAGTETDQNVIIANELLERSKASETNALTSFFTETINPMAYIQKAFKYVAVGLGSIGYYVLMIISKFYLLILMGIGPLAIGISIIPAYSNSAANFFHKAVSYMLWVPLGGLVNSAVAVALASISDQEENGLLILCLAVLQIVLYLQIPKIAHEVMMIGGSRQGTGISQAITNTAVQAATKGIK